MKVNRTLLHQLWTKASSAPNYDKKQWLGLEEHLKEFERKLSEAEALVKKLEEGK